MEAEEFENLKLENQICFPIYALSRKVIRLYKPLLKKFNLTYTQYITMLVLWEKENISLKELGAELYLDSGTLSPVVKKLVKQGLVEKYRSQLDERIVKLRLTNQGKEMKKEAVKIPEKLFSKFKGQPETLNNLKENLNQVLTQF
ncbi:MarR family winged helix-turn-helix transcriptional regulator [Halanaerobium praevalens]|uniref:HTH-type transcriptional regulator SarZ n=1 Tax=Halanaerobium praevalens (strain ATCC 33744 / DSM 2228 / GSL) TaxID=572479 RepID=E3DQK2_HALPG|nr:MarR family transcriptional regulator [Halanaerobium praevalens]ADO77913.1 transcriptional regulator, MarR family [Halanaerobium praevalens DSM 2228]